MRFDGKTRCPHCGARSIAPLAKAGVSAREPVTCPACGAHLELGPVWGWILAVAAPGIFAVVFIALFFALGPLPALLLTLLISSVGYLALVNAAPLKVVQD